MRRLLSALWSSLRLHHFLGLFLALTILPAFAAGLGVAPTLLEFAPNEVAKGLTLRNTGTTALRAQVRIFMWQQQDGKEVLTPSTALVASPPFLNIAPGGKQVLRVIQRGDAGLGAVSGERSFRILIDELPAASVDDLGVGGKLGAQPGLNFLLRFSVPAFIESPFGETAAKLNLRLQNTEAGVKLTTENTGSGRAQITNLALLSSEGRVVYEHKGLVGYLLAGSSRIWTFNLPSSAATATEIRMQVNGQPTRHPLAPADLTD
ncbi:fimbria/pilus periplasmic chaperone [uncultured Zhongshania sp.]|mgnify:CR=1 FL=1|uniref:fimbrial biogenesis chaperone n=1 Tax=uncultured Zhongshania sp. TaxID=1642288 RepID=UPI0030DC987B|tara:strand:- start:1253 stop:2041 length:789 start_codon:yes stop_codon:yes gene_type:complete